MQFGGKAVLKTESFVYLDTRLWLTGRFLGACNSILQIYDRLISESGWLSVLRIVRTVKQASEYSCTAIRSVMPLVIRFIRQ